MNTPRKAWLAVLLTLLVSGLGHLYSGAARRGLFFYFIGQTAVISGGIALIMVPGKLGLILCASLFAGYLVFCIADVVKISRPVKFFYTLKPYNRWYVYVLCWLLSAFVFESILAAVIKTNITQAYKIPSGGMVPTLEMGDQILTKKKLLLGNRDIERGDVVIFPYPKDPSIAYIKRVIGLGGEKIEIREKQVYINGTPLEEPYVVYMDPSVFSRRDDMDPLVIPDDSLFLMGDNRDNSNDSRFWGLVKKDSVSATAFKIYWSWDKDAMRIRWERIGAPIF